MDRLKILVVDDESRMRKLVRDFLVKSNFEVLEAGDGEEALDIFYKDAKNGWLAGMPGDPCELPSSYYYADSPRR